ncbi:hypothetical protein LSAT2_020824 [Lamellibrachia satsuma]|nr:hypothetical protein LSAT2_020824 [Lamellibrachia satsuma]
MAASGWKITQVVKPHVQMIKFRHQAAANVGAAAANKVAATSTAMPHGDINHKVAATSTPMPHEDINHKSVPVTSIHHESDIPPRYRRLPISEEEMEYITRGGPE